MNDRAKAEGLLIQSVAEFLAGGWGYLGIDDDTLWSVVRTDIPALLPLLRGPSNQ